MRLKTIGSLLILSLLLCLQNNAFGQEIDCKKFQNGSFYVEKDGIISTKIERIGNIQYEIDEAKGIRLKLEVNWLDDCTYTLQLIEVLENEAEKPFNHDMIVVVEITSTEENGYTQRSTVEGIEGSFESKIVKIN